MFGERVPGPGWRSRFYFCGLGRLAVLRSLLLTIICFLGEALEAQRTGTQEGEEQAKPTGWRGGKGLVVVRCGPPAAVDAGLRCECG